MNNSQRIATAAVAGAVASTVVTLCRSTIGRLFDYAERRARRAELKRWYNTEIWSAEGSTRSTAKWFVETHQDLLQQMKNREVYYDPSNIFPLTLFTKRINAFMLLYWKADITRAYSVQLFGVDDRLARQYDLLATEMTSELNIEAARMRADGYPMTQLYAELKNYL